MEKIRIGEPDMFAFFELTPDLVCIAGKDGYFRKVNPAVIEKLGYTKEELFASPIHSFIHPEDKDVTQKERAKLLEGETLINFQNRFVSKTGKTVWLEWTSIYMPDKEIVFAIAKDITERKLAEKEIEERYIRFKKLAVHFKSNLEKSQKYLAGELHEELAQLVSVVRMDIDSVAGSEAGLSALSRGRIEHALAVTDLLINTIRRITFSISPHILDDLGLNAALEWQCKEFSLLNGIPCLFGSALDETLLTREVKLDFFRVCQESLINVAHHAQAKCVKVSLTDTGDTITLSITDDGKGFEFGKQNRDHGLTSMQERMASINGQFFIQTEPGKGTCIRVAIAK